MKLLVELNLVPRISPYLDGFQAVYGLFKLGKFEFERFNKQITLL